MSSSGSNRSPRNVVLVCPEIPQNTGNIGRLCVSTETHLHLVKPLGFSLDDRYVKRAGMDYWQHLELTVHESWRQFLEYAGASALYFFTTKSERLYWDCPFEPESFLIFGNEGSGLPEDFYAQYEEYMYTIPMTGSFSRSLNLANSTAVIVYESIRKSYLK